MGAFFGSYLGTSIQQALREAEHAKRQGEGNQMLARRLQITIPWQPAMANHPSFVCAHCHFPHMLRQTLLGCTACAAPYFPSEIARLNKKGSLTCVACATEQSIDAMPFCCIQCRCIQGVPTQMDWRRTFPIRPVWRVFQGPIITMLLGLLIVLVCAVIGWTYHGVRFDDMMIPAVFLGGGPILFGALGMIPILLRKSMPSEMMLSCGGFGYRTTTGEERWFSWRDVSGMDTRQQTLYLDATTGHPDSTALGWAIRVGKEQLAFDTRLDQSREFAREIRMRSPAAPLADMAPVKPRNPWLVFCLVLIVIVLCVGLVMIATAKG